MDTKLLLQSIKKFLVIDNVERSGSVTRSSGVPDPEEPSRWLVILSMEVSVECSGRYAK